MLHTGAVQRSTSAISMTRQIPYRIEPLIARRRHRAVGEDHHRLGVGQAPVGLAEQRRDLLAALVVGLRARGVPVGLAGLGVDHRGVDLAERHRPPRRTISTSPWRRPVWSKTGRRWPIRGGPPSSSHSRASETPVVRVPASSSSILRSPRPPSPSWPNSRNGSRRRAPRGERDRRRQRRAAAGRALDVEAPAERLDARARGPAAGAARGAGAAGAVVGDGRRRSVRPCWTIATRSVVAPGVLDRVRERLGDEEPDRGLDHGGQAARRAARRPRAAAATAARARRARRAGRARARPGAARAPARAARGRRRRPARARR